MREDILEPALPIVDPHHHLWDWRSRLPHMPPPTHRFEAILRQSPRYLLDELLADTGGGHNVIATVYIECGSFYRADGPDAMKPVGKPSSSTALRRWRQVAFTGPRASAPESLVMLTLL